MIVSMFGMDEEFAIHHAYIAPTAHVEEGMRGRLNYNTGGKFATAAKDDIEERTQREDAGTVSNTVPLRFILSNGTRFRPLELRGDAEMCALHTAEFPEHHTSVVVDYGASGKTVQVHDHYTGLQTQGFTPQLKDVVTRAMQLHAR